MLKPHNSRIVRYWKGSCSNFRVRQEQETAEKLGRMQGQLTWFLSKIMTPQFQRKRETCPKGDHLHQDKNWLTSCNTTPVACVPLSSTLWGQWKSLRFSQIWKLMLIIAKIPCYKKAHSIKKWFFFFFKVNGVENKQ